MPLDIDANLPSRMMRDEGKFLGGDDIKRPPNMFVGAANNPYPKGLGDAIFIKILSIYKNIVYR